MIASRRSCIWYLSGSQRSPQLVHRTWPGRGKNAIASYGTDTAAVVQPQGEVILGLEQPGSVTGSRRWTVPVR
jgi:hypothetical protein